MKYVAALLWLAVCLPAATIGAPDASAILHSGDALAFEIGTWNFGVNAARFSLPQYPEQVSFTFVTTVIAADTAFSAWIESPDRSTVLAFDGSPQFTEGWYSSPQFSGAVSTFSGYLAVRPEDSETIFASGAARLLLVNMGPETVAGLPFTELRQDLSVSLAAGPLTVGALPGAAHVITPVHIAAAAPAPAAQAAEVRLATPVPEPAAAGLVAAALAAFWLQRRVRRR